MAIVPVIVVTPVAETGFVVAVLIASNSSAAPAPVTVVVNVLE